MRILWLIVAGAPDGSTAGNTTWAVMIVSTPAAIAALKGGRSVDSNVARSWVTMGRPKWLSTPVSP